MLNLYTSDWQENFISRHQNALITATLILVALAAGGCGAKALGPGMNRDRVIAALGKPSYVYSCNEALCSTSPLGTGTPSTILIYKRDATTVLTVGLDEHGIIYEQTVADIQGPEDEERLCSITAYVLTRARDRGLMTFSSSTSPVSPHVLVEQSSSDPRTAVIILRGDTFLAAQGDSLKTTLGADYIPVVSASSDDHEWKVHIKEYHLF